MRKAVVIFSGGIDSVCTCAYLKPRYNLYGVSFSYGQRSTQEIKKAKSFAKILQLKQHKILDISFMRDLYGDSNVLTSSTKNIPQSFDYSIVVPIRNAVFLTIAGAWAFTLKASLVAYGAHKDDSNYSDCRPSFSKKIEDAINEGEKDGIKVNIRKEVKIWSPYIEGLSKSDLLKKGYKMLGDQVFKTWSCYYNKKFHCGICESCNNRKAAFRQANIPDKTEYLN